MTAKDKRIMVRLTSEQEAAWEHAAAVLSKRAGGAAISLAEFIRVAADRYTDIVLTEERKGSLE